MLGSWAGIQDLRRLTELRLPRLGTKGGNDWICRKSEIYTTVIRECNFLSAKKIKKSLGKYLPYLPFVTDFHERWQFANSTVSKSR